MRLLITAVLCYFAIGIIFVRITYKQWVPKLLREMGELPGLSLLADTTSAKVACLIVIVLEWPKFAYHTQISLKRVPKHRN